MARKLRDKRLLALIGRYLQAGVLVGSRCAGEGLNTSITVLSSKSYRHLSPILATQSGMTNEWLKRLGLISIRDLWMKAHGYA